HAHVAEQSTDLKAAHQAASRNLVRLEPQQRASIEKNVAAVRRIEAGNEVDERRLAGAVRSDQPADLARRDRKIDVVGCQQPAEAFDQVARFEEGGHGMARPYAWRVRSPNKPVGRINRTSTTSRKP